MSISDDRNVNPIQELTRLANSYFDSIPWQFQKTYHSDQPTTLIYDSEWCRVNFVWGGLDPLSGNSLSIFYGRLHAPNEKSTMIWNGEECNCWHTFKHALYFLAGYHPIDAVKLRQTHPITDPFYEAEFRRKFRRRQPEWLIQMHSAVLKHYGQRFLSLFDLRHPELWDQYRQFLREYYDIEGRIPEIIPSMDKVC